jgi:amino acid transporter
MRIRRWAMAAVCFALAAAALSGFFHRWLTPYVILAELVVGILFTWLGLRTQSAAARRTIVRTIIIPSVAVLLIVFIAAFIYGAAQPEVHHPAG